MNKISVQNLFKIATHIFYVFALTSVYLLIVGDTPTTNQSLFLLICFLGSLVYLIINSLKDNSILSFMFGYMVTILTALIILYICLIMTSYQKRLFMLVSLFIYFLAMLLLLYFTKFVKMYKSFYKCSILIIGIIGTIILFTAYLYPEESTYKSIYDTIIYWGKIPPNSNPDEMIYIIQIILLNVSKFTILPYLGYVTIEKFKGKIN